MLSYMSMSRCVRMKITTLVLNSGTLKLSHPTPLSNQEGEVANRILTVGDAGRAQRYAKFLDQEGGHPVFRHASPRGFLTYTGDDSPRPILQMKGYCMHALPYNGDSWFWYLSRKITRCTCLHHFHRDGPSYDGFLCEVVITSPSFHIAIKRHLW